MKHNLIYCNSCSISAVCTPTWSCGDCVSRGCSYFEYSYNPSRNGWHFCAVTGSVRNANFQVDPPDSTPCWGLTSTTTSTAGPTAWTSTTTSTAVPTAWSTSTSHPLTTASPRVLEGGADGWLVAFVILGETRFQFAPTPSSAFSNHRSIFYL